MRLGNDFNYYVYYDYWVWHFLITKLMIIVKTTPGMGVQALTAGSAACFADVITFPLDVVKVRKLIN